MSTPLPNPFLDLIPENNNDFSPALIEFLDGLSDDPPPMFLQSPSEAYLEALWNSTE
jgi:hypothetical protein